jgi:hypothetical protein
MNLDDGNFSLYAAKYYDNNNCTDILEFHDDLNRIKYIKRLLKLYTETGQLKERLILNHMITLYNVFYHEACTKMIVFKLYEYMPVLKSFLVYLNYWPEKIEGLGYNGIILNCNEVESDPYVDSILERI